MSSRKEPPMLGLLIALVVIQSITLLATISTNGHLLRIRETLQHTPNPPSNISLGANNEMAKQTHRPRPNIQNRLLAKTTPTGTRPRRSPLPTLRLPTHNRSTPPPAKLRMRPHRRPNRQQPKQPTRPMPRLPQETIQPPRRNHPPTKICAVPETTPQPDRKTPRSTMKGHPHAIHPRTGYASPRNHRTTPTRIPHRYTTT